MKRLPKIALVGRPNVGKSALFNRICQKRISIVDEEEGITRDRIYAEAEVFGRAFCLIDTGGIDFAEKILFADLVKIQAEVAIEEADAIVLVVDGRVGVTKEDEMVAKLLQKGKKPLFLAVNKCDNAVGEEGLFPFFSLGISKVFGVSALQGVQVAELLESIFEAIPEEEAQEVEEVPFPKVAILGRANVGKSTLFNALLAEERSIVSPVAGTTRDAVDMVWRVGDLQFLLIDTAGIRRKKGEKEVVDKFAAIRTEEAIARADVCLLVVDSFEGFTTQERRIASEIEKAGKSCLLLCNKWDKIEGLRMEHALRGIREAAPFLAHCPVLCISAKDKRNIGKIAPLVQQLAEARKERIGTGALNTLIERSLQKYHPPLITGKRLRIYYLTQVETNPPKFVLFVNRADLLTDTYKKYLIHQMREKFPFPGCPIVLELRGKEKVPGETCLL